MIFTQKKNLAKFLDVSMYVLRGLIKSGDVIQIMNDKEKCVGYIHVTHFAQQILSEKNKHRYEKKAQSTNKTHLFKKK